LTVDFVKYRTGIPGLTSVSDARYVMFNFGDVDHHLEQFDAITKISPGATVILNAYNDGYNCEYLLHRINALGLTGRCFVFVSDQQFATDHHRHGIRFFPFAWHWLHSYHSREFVAGPPPQPCMVDWNSRTHRLSCLNRMPSYSRFRTYYELQKQSWFPDVYNSFGGVGMSTTSVIDPYCGLESDAYQWFQAHQHEFPYSSQTDYAWTNNWEFSVPAYADTYANLVTETFGESVFMTEKTVKPLAAGNLVFVSAQKNFLQLLRNLKFDIDFEGVNQNYDMLPTWLERIQAMVKEIDRVYDNIPDIWHTNQQRLIYNQQWLFSDDFKNLMLTDVKDLFDYV